MKFLKPLTWQLLPIVCSLISGCDKGGGTVRHGNLGYNATDIFAAGTQALALAKAAGRGDVKEINRLVSDGVNVNGVGNHDITPFWLAIWIENPEGFEALLNKGANPNAQRADGYPIMYLAANMKDSRFLEAALKYGGDPNLLDKRTGGTPLVMAVQNGYKRNVDLLLAAKGNANWQDSISGETLPMVALGSRVDYEMAYELLQHGADPTLKMHGYTLADTIALVSRNASNNNDPWRVKVIEFLRSKGVIERDSFRK